MICVNFASAVQIDRCIYFIMHIYWDNIQDIWLKKSINFGLILLKNKSEYFFFKVCVQKLIIYFQHFCVIFKGDSSLQKKK